VPADLLAPETIEALKRYDWSGNVRELANALEHACILADQDVIRPEHLPSSVTRGATVPMTTVTETVALPQVARTLREIEMEVIYRTLDKHKGDKPKTAAELGIALKTLYNKLNSDQTRVAG
jgi:DNA-binding NtrC family response regulator